MSIMGDMTKRRTIMKTHAWVMLISTMLGMASAAVAKPAKDMRGALVDAAGVTYDTGRPEKHDMIGRLTVATCPGRGKIARIDAYYKDGGNGASSTIVGKVTGSLTALSITSDDDATCKVSFKATSSDSKLQYTESCEGLSGLGVRFSDTMSRRLVTPVYTHDTNIPWSVARKAP